MYIYTYTVRFIFLYVYLILLYYMIYAGMTQSAWRGLQDETACGDLMSVHSNECFASPRHNTRTAAKLSLTCPQTCSLMYS